MDRLPFELVQLICRALPQKDLAHFRLTCKAFAEIGAKYMVEQAGLVPPTKTVLSNSFSSFI